MTNRVNKQIEQLIKQADKLAIKEVERLARIVLVKNSTKTYDFTMAMGSFFFTKPDKDVMWDHQMEKLIGYKALRKFVEKWDDTLKLTGEPMTFTAKGKKINNW